MSKLKILLALVLALSMVMVGCAQPAATEQPADTEQPAAEEQEREAEITTLKTTVRSLGGFKVEAESRGFKFIMDEPEEEGGSNTGMNPCEAVLGAFGGCQTIVAVAYAESMGIDLQEYWVELEGDFDMGGFMGVEGVFPGYTEVRYTIHIKSDSPQEEVDEFISFVEAVCPVGNTIASEVKMVRAGVIIEE